VPTPASRAKSVGVYVHFPYCLAKCPYCDFLSVPSAAAEIPHVSYANAVLAELRSRGPSVAQGTLRSVFFGGGTPSLWDAKELGRVLAAIRGAFPAAPSVEITAECNPSSFDDRVAAGLREVGVNRVSLGVQSLNAERLAFLGRLHDRGGALRALETAQRHGFPRVSADLIFGVAGQTAAEAATEARIVAETGVTHLSAYALTIEPGTQFGELHRRGKLPLLPDDNVAESFAAVEAALAELGLRHYEISNYAKPGAEAQHNLGYWRGDAYLGLGAGAWGTLRSPGGERLRYRNTPAIERYLAWEKTTERVELEREGAWVSVVEHLTPEQALSERLMLGLRLAEGVHLEAAERETGAPVWTRERRRAIEKWQSRGALTLGDDGQLRLKASHWLLADGIIADLL
jgi:putative oxygen-independent coproporphyrinogen III oxidase